MCYVFVNFFATYQLQLNWGKNVFAAKPATKVLSKLVVAAISVRCRSTKFLRSQSIFLLQVTQYRESPI